jgi:hypothetical protein
MANLESGKEGEGVTYRKCPMFLFVEMFTDFTSCFSITYTLNRQDVRIQILYISKFYQWSPASFNYTQNYVFKTCWHFYQISACKITVASVSQSRIWSCVKLSCLHIRNRACCNVIYPNQENITKTSLHLSACHAWRYISQYQLELSWNETYEQIFK